jgi:hypothetical protein
MKREKYFLLITYIFLIIVSKSCTKNIGEIKSDFDIDEEILEIARMIDEERFIKQSTIMDYSDLPGTFWTM